MSDPHRGSVRHSNVAVLTTSPTRLLEVCQTWRHKEPLDDENYARDILKEQYNNGWGGITQEVVDICLEVGLKNACEEYVSREDG